jgi:hypothetical protein
VIVGDVSASVAITACEYATVFWNAGNVADVLHAGAEPAVTAFNDIPDRPVEAFVTMTSYGASVGLNESGRVAIIDVFDPTTICLADTNVASSDFLNCTAAFVAKLVPVIVVVEF